MVVNQVWNRAVAGPGLEGEMSEDGTNGEVGKAKQVDTVILRYDRERDEFELGGHANSLHVILDMLARATRIAEARLREQQAIELQAKLRETTKTAALLDSIMGKQR